MTITFGAGHGAATGRRRAAASPGLGRAVRRAALVAALAAGAISAADPAGSAEAVARAGGELTALLRFMAAIKAAMAVGVSAAVWWRLALPAAPGRLLAYLASAAAMAAGPVLIWGMAHVGLGALLLHGGLLVTLLVLWRDPAVAARLGAMVAARRRGARLLDGGE